MKHVLITGGSDGLGRVTAQKLVSEGYRVTILGNEAEKTRIAADEIGCSFVVADVRDYTAVESAMRQAEQDGETIDILVNNAGIWIEGELEACDPERIQQVVETNVLGVMYCTRAVVAGMKERRSGKIINVISQAGLTLESSRTVYYTTKWAITGFTKCLEKELGTYHISVSGLYPGSMRTDFYTKAGYEKDLSSMLDPAVVADAIVYICNQPDDAVIKELGIESIEY